MMDALMVIQFPGPRAFRDSSDLVPLQQSHILGNFHHRFHPTRPTFHFGVNSPSIYNQQSHQFVPPQQQQQQQQQQQLNQRNLQQNIQLNSPGLRQNVGLNQNSDLVNQNFKSLPPITKSNVPFGSSNQDPSIKDAYPSNAPHTLKFSISSQNYNPNQGKQFSNSVSSQPKLNNQFIQGRGLGVSQVQPTRPTTNHLSSVNVQQQQQTSQYNTGQKVQQTFYQNPNTYSKPVPTFNPPTSNSLPQQPFNTIQSSNLRTTQQSNELLSTNTFSNKQVLTNNVNFNLNSQPHHISPLLNSQIRTNSEFKTNTNLIQQQQKTNVEPPVLPTNFRFPTDPTQQTFQRTNLLGNQQLYQNNNNNNNNNQQLGQFNYPSVPSNFEQQVTEQPRLLSSQQQILKSQPPSVVPPFSSTLPDLTGRKLAFEKAQNHLHLALNEKYLSTPLTNIIPTSSPSKETFTTAPAYTKPKPVVKEITINLNDHKISGDGLPPQLYIKDTRQKEYQEIKSSKEGGKEQNKKEKTQEELINEQIHKLLQSHNLEIVGKDNEAQTNSQEAQLSKVSEQFQKYNYSVQLLNSGGLLSESKVKPTVAPELPPLPDLPEHIKKQYDIKLVHKDDLLKQFDLSGDHNLGNDSSKLFIANGQKLEIVQFSKDGIMDKIPIGTKNAVREPTTTAKPPKLLFEELTKEVIPPGANFELIKHKGDGQVEKVNDFTGGKKVTFVFLEEQEDGSVKIQGVKGNGNQDADGNEVDSLIKKIKNGSLKLPPSLKSKEISDVYGSSTEKLLASPTATVNSRSIQNLPSLSPNYVEKEYLSNQRPTTEFTFNGPSLYSADVTSKFTPSYYETTPQPPTTFSPNLNYVRSTTVKTQEKFRTRFTPTVPSLDTFTPTFGSRRIKPTISSRIQSPETARLSQTGSLLDSQSEFSDYSNSEILSHRSTEYRGQKLRIPQDVVAEESNINAVRPLNEVLKVNGLNEMAKFLEQSGLDTILNETGPYTIFVPTDKAFKKLETQLGGPDKAEEKFRENPRLLSGLLLHHVVPGSFRVEDLQDEMTGVSLAGTQLRVNTYFTDKKQSKENNIVTVNGAKIMSESQNIVVPQGLAHTIDKVLFPLPIGDIFQTLKSDREKRFTKFIKALEHSGLSDLLTGVKTYTVFAPTDKAFSVLTDSELDKLLTNQEAAKTIALRHIVPGTLYTAGMNYYQVMDSMEPGQKVVIKKEIANSAQITTGNIPATNGVIHAVETLL
ncbi:conserved hypothetical protein [Pediculus humanus corporis]|uniref:FAS1 domain-containing protein n=1 Tax=Pediculus humanus subsp. corporis TaxID=121224 RepID=E0VJP2_PEDHC|nr:uncharacterized protein Phum_PHUM248810 [Pediculus humanus corporis]EEB13598.1 conserved hypothetical protein [Pediculus humanus corporis]